MPSARLRNRAPKPGELDFDGAMESAKNRNPRSSDDFIPPRYTIDLSVPPEQRYSHLAQDFRAQVRALPALFDEIIASMVPPSLSPWIHRFARLTLRRVYCSEETRELRGISTATGLNMHLLVAFNVLLDLLMGCTSGGVRVKDPASSGHGARTKMLHFRTLDWGMDPLRQVVVELDFVRQKGGPVVATSVTYFGYVGVLTGVRKGLSISLNFRPRHDAKRWLERVRWDVHLLLVLFGFRRSISSVLRGYLLPKSGWTESPLDIAAEVKEMPSTAAYLIFCTGPETVSIEKDHRKAKVERSEDYIVTLNHDRADEEKPRKGQASLSERAQREADALNDATGMSDIIKFSISRKKCTVRLWKKAMAKRRNDHAGDEDCLAHVTTSEVLHWMEGNEITNEETHYAVVMDAAEGQVIWRRRWLEPKNLAMDMRS